MMLAQPQNDGLPQFHHECHELIRLRSGHRARGVVFDDVPLLAAELEVLDVGTPARPEDQPECLDRPVVMECVPGTVAFGVEQSRAEPQRGVVRDPEAPQSAEMSPRASARSRSTIPRRPAISSLLVVCARSQPLSAHSRKLILVPHHEQLLRLQHAQDEVVARLPPPAQLLGVHHMRVDLPTQLLRDPPQPA